MKLEQLFEDINTAKIRTSDLENILADFWIHIHYPQNIARAIVKQYVQNILPRHMKEELEWTRDADWTYNKKYFLVKDLQDWWKGVSYTNELNSGYGDLRYRKETGVDDAYPFGYLVTWKKIYQVAGLGVFKDSLSESKSLEDATITARQLYEIFKECWIDHNALNKAHAEQLAKSFLLDFPHSMITPANDDATEIPLKYTYKVSDLQEIYHNMQRHWKVTVDGDQKKLKELDDVYPFTVLKTWKRIWQVAGLGAFKG